MVYACQHCGEPAPHARESCPQCGGFRTIAAAPSRRAPSTPRRAPPGGPVHVSEIVRDDPPRASTGVRAFDRVLDPARGRGVAVPSSIVMWGGPGSGKTTHAARMADSIARARRGEALYLSGEMPAPMVLAAATRDGTALAHTWIWNVTDLELADAEIARRRPCVFVVDSIQAFGVGREYGTDAAVREVVRVCLARVRELGAVAILISQETKDGDPAGPHRTIHDADVVLHLSPDRVACPRKNRYGETPREAKLTASKPRRGALRLV